MKAFSKMNKVIGITMLMLMIASAGKAEEMVFDAMLDMTDKAQSSSKDYNVKLSSPSSARGIVYVDKPNGIFSQATIASQTGPAQVSTLKGTFRSVEYYYCCLLAYPKTGYVLDGFVKASDYLANRTSNNYYIKNSDGKIYKSGEDVPFAKVEGASPSTSVVPTSVFSTKESIEYYAIFRPAISQTVTVNTPGKLRDAVMNSVTDNLIVKGKINNDDISFLKTMVKSYNIVRLNLSEAIIDNIPNNAFYQCKSLYEVKLPATGLVEIGDHAFEGCTSLISCPIPSSVKRIGEGIFDECYSKELFEKKKIIL